MFVQMGRKKEPSDIVDLLLECHERIRSFSALARRLGEAEQLPEAEVKEAAFRVHRYFVEALPLHVVDEEESITPRLRGREPQLDAALARMSREHTEHTAPLASLVALCDELRAAPAKHARLREELAGIAATLERDLGAHLEHEEALILPAIRRLVPTEEQALMMKELRARRDRAQSESP